MSERLDITLVKRGLAPSREKAKAAIAAGAVRVNGRPSSKPSAPVEPGDAVEVSGETLRFVGRGGLKLEKALAVFGIDLQGANCVDVGASTGGFTDCMLQAGAARVAAVDVGHGQLDARIAADPRVVDLEGTDARAVSPEEIGGPFDFAATDVSFISLAHILPALAGLLRDGGRAVCLVKPQFEAGPEHIGKRGVVRDPAVHRDVLARTLQLARAAGFAPCGLDYSPVTGGEGNIEYLLFAERRAGDAPEGAARAAEDAATHGGVPGGADARPAGTRPAGGSDLDADRVVAAAHEALGRRTGARGAGR